MGNPIIKGDNAIVWGIDDVYSLGYVQKVRDLTTGEEVEIADGDGDAVAAVLFNTRGEFDAECIIKSTDTIPTRGADVTIASKANCTVLDVEINWENKGAKKLTLKCKRYAFAMGGGAG